MIKYSTAIEVGGIIIRDPVTAVTNIGIFAAGLISYLKLRKRKLEYPPTTEYLRIGSNPDPNLEQPEQKPVHGPMDPGGKEFKMAQ